MDARRSYIPYPYLKDRQSVSDPDQDSDPELVDPNRDAEQVHHALPSGFSPGYGDTSDPYDHAVPPGYDWPTHGGYLGCLLGLMVSCLIGGFVGSTFFPTLAHYHWVPGWVAILLTVVVFFVIIIAIGRLGYVLGKRFLREYSPPTRKTWGEDDDYVDPAVAEIAASDADEDDQEDTPGGDTSGQAAYLRDR